jgi:phosphoribosylformylglycinamidine synthase
MKFGVVIFPGSNCDQDMVGALRNDLGQQVIELWHKDNDLSAFSTDDCIVLPGGFSFGDYLRCGAIARFSPMMQQTIEFAKRGGKVFGVCNGFQILCESGLLPGVLLKNANQQFVCKNVFIKGDDGQVLKIPIAHGDITIEANPNGATYNIAGICNKERNVFGMMPHPERACSDKLANIDGQHVFQELFFKKVKETLLA